MGGGRGQGRHRRAWWADAALALVMMAAFAAAFVLTRGNAPSPADGPPASVAIAASEPVPLGPPAPAPTVASTTTVAPADPAACHPSYQGTCIPPTVRDASCFGMGESAPWMVKDYDVKVVGEDVFRLDVDFDGVACESQPGLHGAQSG